MLQLDAVLFEQVLFNLLDNAAKYSSVDTVISIRSWRERNQVLLQIADEGEGIPAAELKASSTNSNRAQKGDHVRPAPGWGLPSRAASSRRCRAAIFAANRSDRTGAVLTIQLPIPAAANKLDTAA